MDSYQELNVFSMLQMWFLIIINQYWADIIQPFLIYVAFIIYYAWFLFKKKRRKNRPRKIHIRNGSKGMRINLKNKRRKNILSKAQKHSCFHITWSSVEKPLNDQYSIIRHDMKLIPIFKSISKTVKRMSVLNHHKSIRSISCNRILMHSLTKINCWLLHRFSTKN